MSFSALGLAPGLLRAVAAQGYTDPTPVQREAIPHVLAGRDLMAGAQTGTGKTAAFVLPMLQRLVATERPGQRRIRALILAPTRELALQVEESVRVYGSNSRKSVAIYGGVGFVGQVNALRRNPEIVVATPGRLLDHARQRTIDLSNVEILVLDEADRMLDMGCIRDTRALADFKAGRVTLLIATEVAARGIDIESLPHVVNYELPMVANDYLHRIGRTGRAGLQGDAISLVCVDEGPMLRDIERLLGSAIPTEVVPGFEPDPSIRPQPIRLRTGGAGGGRMPHRAAGRPSPMAYRAPRPRRFGRSGGRPAHAGGSSIGNRSGRWTALPGERNRR